MDKKKDIQNASPRKRLSKLNPILLARKAMWSSFYFQGFDYDRMVGLIEHNILLVVNEFIDLLKNNSLITTQVGEDGEIRSRYDRQEIERILDKMFTPYTTTILSQTAVNDQFNLWKKLFFGTFKIYLEGERDLRIIAQKMGVSYNTYISEMYYMTYRSIQYGHAEGLTGLMYRYEPGMTVDALINDQGDKMQES